MTIQDINTISISTKTEPLDFEDSSKQKTSMFKKVFKGFGKSRTTAVAREHIPRSSSELECDLLNISDPQQNQELKLIFWKNSIFSMINRQCKSLYESEFADKEIDGFDDLNQQASDMSNKIIEQVIESPLGLKPILETITTAHEKLPLDSEIRSSIEPIMILQKKDYTPRTLLWKFNLRYNSISQNSSPRLKTIIHNVMCPEISFVKMQFLQSTIFKEKVLLNVKVWLLNQVNSKKIEWTLDDLQTEDTTPLSYTQCITNCRRDRRLLYPTEILRGLVAEGGQVHPNTINVSGFNILADRTFRWNDTEETYKVKELLNKKFVLKPIVRHLSDSLREESLSGIADHLLVNQFVELETAPADIYETNEVDLVFEKRKHKYTLDDDPDTRLVEMNDIKKELLYEIRAHSFFKENPEFPFLGLLTIGAFGPVRTIQEKLFPLTCHSHHSDDADAFITTANKDFGTHLEIRPLLGGSLSKKIVSVVQKKKFFLKYTKASEDKFSTQLNGSPPVSFSVTWVLEASTDFELPIEGTARFHDIRINQALPVDEQQRIARVFLIYSFTRLGISYY